MDIAREAAAGGNSVTWELPEEFKDSGELPTEEDLSFATVKYSKFGITPDRMKDLVKCLETSTSNTEGRFAFINDYLTVIEEFANMGFQMYLNVMNYAENNQVDIIIADLAPAFYAACPILKERYNTTCFITTPLISRNPDAGERLGHALPAWMPATFLGKGIAETFSERVMQQLSTKASSMIGKLAKNIMIEKVKQDVIDRGYDPSIMRQLQPTLVNSFQGLDWNIPLYPHIKYIGPVNLEVIEATRDEYIAKHERYETLMANNQSLPDDFTSLDLYLEENKDIIVISFGKSVELTQEQVNTVIGFANSIQPIPVLWTIRERHLHLLPENLPTNMRIETWVNLIGVLSHVNTNLLVSQCGVATAHESILTQTPVLCIPFLYDQFDIVSVVKHNNLGEYIKKKDLSAETLKEMVEFMIPKKEEYQENARNLMKLAKLKPSVSEVVEWMNTLHDIGDKYVLPPVHVGLLPFYAYYEVFYIATGIVFLLLQIPLSLSYCYFCQRKPKCQTCKKQKIE